jgi:hypothetical protein
MLFILEPVVLLRSKSFHLSGQSSRHDRYSCPDQGQRVSSLRTTPATLGIREWASALSLRVATREKGPPPSSVDLGDAEKQNFKDFRHSQNERKTTKKLTELPPASRRKKSTQLLKNVKSVRFFADL